MKHQLAIRVGRTPDWTKQIRPESPTADPVVERGRGVAKPQEEGASLLKLGETPSPNQKQVWMLPDEA